MHNTAFRRRGKVCDPRMQGTPMRRRELITLLGGMATAWPLGARAQRPRKFPFVGVLVSASHPHPFADAFWRGLHALGYSDGENIKVEIRYTDGRSDRAKEYAEELDRLSPDVIVAHYAQAVSAAMAATRTIPIVMAPHGAPLQLGAVDSLARPGGNVTGLSGMDAEIGGKRVELLRELIPNLRCIAALGKLAAIETKPPAAVTSRLPDMYASRCLAASSIRITRCGSKNGMTITACASALAMVAKALRNSLGPPISIGSNRRPALVTAKRRSSTKGPLYGVVVRVAERAAMQRRFGMSSRRSSTRLPPISASIPDRPVTFPPGRAKLPTTPNCKGAPCGAMTIGIVRVAAMAAETASA